MRSPFCFSSPKGFATSSKVIKSEAVAAICIAVKKRTKARLARPRVGNAYKTRSVLSDWAVRELLGAIPSRSVPAVRRRTRHQGRHARQPAIAPQTVMELAVGHGEARSWQAKIVREVHSTVPKRIGDIILFLVVHGTR